MVTIGLTRHLIAMAETILTIDENMILRKDYGPVSLEDDFFSSLQNINKKIRFLLQHKEILHDYQLQPILDDLDVIQASMEMQANFESPEDYINNRANFLEQINAHLRDIEQNWPPVVTAVLDASGLLDDEGLLQAYERASQSIKTESESVLQQVREQGEKTIQEAIDSAENIVGKARSTAAGISVAEAQKQFREAQKALDNRVVIWGTLGLLSITVFISLAWWFSNYDVPNEWRWEVIYHSSIRISILTDNEPARRHFAEYLTGLMVAERKNVSAINRQFASATVAAFCLKILRAQLHMSEKNRHSGKRTAARPRTSRITRRCVST